MDAHSLVAALKTLASELGRTPSRAEFEAAVKGGRYQLQKAFGGYSALIQAAGLDPCSNTARDKRPFGHADIEMTVTRPQDVEIISPLAKNFSYPHESISVVGDTHFPFEHRPAMTWAIDLIAKLNPSIVVQVGDLYDMLSWSKFPKSMNVYTPAQEIQLGRQRAEDFWQRVKAAVPKARCIQMVGNHDRRPFKRLLEQAPALEVFIELERWYRFEGVETILDERQEIDIAGIKFLHGYRTGLGSHRDYMLQNAVVGHSHVGGVTFRQIHGRILFEMNAGFLGDADTKALSYTSQKISNWTLGLGHIDSLGPRFIPFTG
jgi:predicted phosphodiesterase